MYLFWHMIFHTSSFPPAGSPLHFGGRDETQRSQCRGSLRAQSRTRAQQCTLWLHACPASSASLNFSFLICKWEKTPPPSKGHRGEFKKKRWDKKVRWWQDLIPKSVGSGRNYTPRKGSVVRQTKRNKNTDGESRQRRRWQRWAKVASSRSHTEGSSRSRLAAQSTLPSPARSARTSVSWPNLVKQAGIYEWKGDQT